MPPNRRKKSNKQRPNGTNGVADDDVFEVDDKPIKKRYKASSATRQNLRSGDKPSTASIFDKKHVGLKRKSSSSALMPNKMKNKRPAIALSDSDQVSMLSYF